ncbi:MAG: hypothetical protein AB9836_04680 [Aminipila sp.]
MEKELECKICEHMNFEDGHGNPNRYYCNAASTQCTPFKLICKTERHSTEFTIKRTPKWCPLKHIG